MPCPCDTQSKIRKLAEHEYTCSGSPADCVILAGHGVIPFKPEIVISGINRGPNLGTDLVYSGTAAAARQATILGIPGIAVSLATYVGPFQYDALARLVADRLDYFLDLWTPDVSSISMLLPPRTTMTIRLSMRFRAGAPIATP